MLRTGKREVMKTLTNILSTVFIAVGLTAGCGSIGSGGAYDDDAEHNKDYRTFHATGEIEFGKIDDSYTADLVMYIAGNQFMVMRELIQDFQKANPNVKTVYVETIPPGQILKNQLLKQGRVNGEKTNQNPDLYGSVNIEYLKTLQTEGRMEKYMIYTHNKLELMVAKGNPKNIKGPKDLARDDLVQSHPNPLTEGIFKFYGAEMLKDLNIYEIVTGDAQCKGCWAVPGKTWFTERHHRETPYRIENGKADVGIVWTTEVIEAKSQGRNIDGVSIPAPYNKSDKVGYTIGIMNNAKNSANADLYLSYLRTRRAQEIYGKYGFTNASEQELEYKPL
jgi:ABC-type molybdate transport system substrate-binding protein